MRRYDPAPDLPQARVSCVQVTVPGSLFSVSCALMSQFDELGYRSPGALTPEALFPSPKRCDPHMICR